MALLMAHEASKYIRCIDCIFVLYRKELLQTPPVDITPTNGGGKFPWSKVKDIDQFENDWSFKPVKVKGMFDHTQEIHISRRKNGEKGVDIVVPMYTHLNE